MNEMRKQILLAAALISPVMLGTGVSAASTTADSTPVTANFTVSNIDNNNPNPPAPVDPSNPGTQPNPGNKPLNPTGTFGLAYIPFQFDFGTTTLTGSSSVHTTAVLPQGKSFNVGVKDTTHTTRGWILTASLSGQLTTYGAELQTSTSVAKVNDGNGQLNALPSNGMITVPQNVKITSQSTPIMTGNKNHVFSGTYDLNLGDVSLNIPDASKVQAGNATGTVNWNLAQTPQP